METTKFRYVVRYGDAGPRIVDRETGKMAPFTHGAIAADSAALLNAGCRAPIIWISPSQMDEIDARARAADTHNNG